MAITCLDCGRLLDWRMDYCQSCLAALETTPMSGNCVLCGTLARLLGGACASRNDKGVWELYCFACMSSPMVHKKPELPVELL